MDELEEELLLLGAYTDGSERGWSKLLTPSHKKLTIWRMLPYGIAASVSMLVWFACRTETYKTGPNERRFVELSEGSTLMLRENSQAQVRPHLFLFARTVDLKHGEIFIKVAHRINAPFSVRCGEVSVRDIGTAFSVGRDEDRVTTKVKEGVVIMKSSREGSADRITAGTGATKSPSKSLLRLKLTPDSFSWVRPDFTFYNVPLGVVLKKIEIFYGCKITVKGFNIGEHRFRGVIKYESVQDAVRAVADTYNLTYHQTGLQFELKPALTHPSI